MVFTGLVVFVLPASAASNPTIRVKITMNATTSTTIKLNESYRLNETGATLAKGTYTVAVSNGNIRISGNGVDVIKSSITLKRTTESLSSTIAVSNTKYGTINYLGDFVITSVSSKLQFVNHIDLERYLYGVVAYEMSNDFPLEALKAQAVCARNFGYKTISTSGTWDLGDTDSYQVYKGYNSSYKNVIRAVDETAGVVMKYKGSVITAYYSASNGGYIQ